MATVINRSRFRVTVARRTDFARTLPYAAAMKGQGFAPRLARLDDRFEVKIRQRSGPDQCLTVASYEEADLVVKQIEVSAVAASSSTTRWAGRPASRTCCDAICARRRRA